MNNIYKTRLITFVMEANLQFMLGNLRLFERYQNREALVGMPLEDYARIFSANYTQHDLNGSFSVDAFRRNLDAISGLDEGLDGLVELPLLVGRANDIVCLRKHAGYDDVIEFLSERAPEIYDKQLKLLEHFKFDPVYVRDGDYVGIRDFVEDEDGIPEEKIIRGQRMFSIYGLKVEGGNVVLSGFQEPQIYSPEYVPEVIFALNNEYKADFNDCDTALRFTVMVDMLNLCPDSNYMLPIFQPLKT